MVTRRNRKTSRKLNRKIRGGGWGFTGAASIPGQVNNPLVYSGIGDCRATQPPSFISTSQYGRYTGLPGMSGGRRRKQKGGRYGFNMTDMASVAPNGSAWWAGTYPPVQRLACEGSTPNPMNPGPHTPSTQPRIQGGGGPLSLGGDNLAYYSPTAGYSQGVSTFKDSVGAPVQIQTPYDARSMNSACLTTGGPPPLTGALQKGGRRSRTRRAGPKRPRSGSRSRSRSPKRPKV
jgi:hypothetical protein